MTTLPKTSNCILELSDGWLTIWFNRPEKRNALSTELFKDIEIILKSVYSDHSIRGIIFRGKGNMFCAGADLEELKNISLAGEKARAMAMEMSNSAGEVFKAISTAPQITVAAVEGAAMAGAFGIACATDLLVTMADAKYALTETKIGLTPAQIAPYVLNRLGFAKARKLMILGTSFNGQKAFEMSMADYVANNEKEFNDQINDIKKQGNKCAPHAVSVTKKIIYNNHVIDFKKAAILFSDCILHKEGKEGFASFFEKRRPYWNK